MIRILLIEDDSNLRRMLYYDLIEAGYTVSEAIHGADGLRQLHAHPADLVITDMLMPEMDGVETVQQLRRSFPGLKIIAISGGGLASPDHYLKIAQKLGADKTLKKPFTFPELLDAIHELYPPAP
ncbi:MAG TPA: response regulator [Candidatus Acidoferrales bacterium]|nr:response regulator [Candidatus Acidoferrales bacterium]